MSNLFESILSAVVFFLELLILPAEPFVDYLLNGGGFKEIFLLGTCYAAILCGLVLLFHFCFKSIVSPKYAKIMWILIGLRMAVVPFVPESSISLFNLFRQDPKVVEAEPFLPDPERTLTTKIIPGTPFPALEPVLSHPVLPKEQNLFIDILITVFFWIWILGSYFFLFQPVIANWRLNRRLRIVDASMDPRLNNLLKEMRSLMKCNRRIPILITDEIPFPALMGMTNPAILLPVDIAESYTDEELRMIFAHELAHLKRRDIAINWLFAIIRVVHWINPVFWFVTSKIRKLSELTCDEDVLKKLGAEKARAYGETLIKVAERKSTFKRRTLISPVGMTGIHSWKANHRFLKQRISQLGYSKQSTTRLKKVLGWSFVLFFVIFGMTNSEEKPLTQKELLKAREPYEFQPIKAQIALPSPKLPEPQEEDDSENKVIVYNIADLLPNAEDKFSSIQAMKNIRDSIKLVAGRDKLDVMENHEKLSFVIRTTDKNHGIIRHHLKKWREEGWCSFIKLNVRLLSVPKGYDDMIRKQFGKNTPQFISRPSGETSVEEDPEFQKISEPGKIPINSRNIHVTPEWIAMMTSEESLQLVKMAQNLPGINYLAAPKLITIPGNRTYFQSGGGRPVVVGIRKGTDKSGNPFNEPVIETIEDGLTCLVQPVYKKETNHIVLDLKLKQTDKIELKVRKLKPFEIPVPTNKPVSVQVPEVESSLLDMQVLLANQESLLLATGVKAWRSKHHEKLYLLLTCEFDTIESPHDGKARILSPEKTKPKPQEEEDYLPTDVIPSPKL